MNDKNECKHFATISPNCTLHRLRIGAVNITKVIKSRLNNIKYHRDWISDCASAQNAITHIKLKSSQHSNLFLCIIEKLSFYRA